MESFMAAVGSQAESLRKPFLATDFKLLEDGSA